jgi:hypothetical protein
MAADVETGYAQLLPIAPEMEPDEALRRLQINALAAHQHSMGRGDQLVQILQRTISQVERTHNRVQTMSSALFFSGLVVLLAAVGAVLAGLGDVWSALLGTTGGIGSLAAFFWTAPLDRVSASVTDLVKLEAAFLGYIRVIGEIDSFFQMQYIDIIQREDGTLPTTLPQTIRDTTTQMREMMSTTVQLIDEHVTGGIGSLEKITAQLEALTTRLSALEAGA